MKRKLIGIRSSLLVTLPKDWLEAWHLSKGDSVELIADPSNTVIVIRPLGAKPN